MHYVKRLFLDVVWSDAINQPTLHAVICQTKLTEPRSSDNSSILINYSFYLHTFKCSNVHIINDIRCIVGLDLKYKNIF